jgi:hypothetical protein
MNDRWISFAARGMCAATLTGSLLAPAVAHADVILGAETSGTARRFAVTCSTCPNPVTTISSQHDGGSASVVDAANTLALRFTQGNTSLLTPGLVPTGPGPDPGPGATVPEPATLILLGTGLAITSRKLRQHGQGASRTRVPSS